MVYVSSCGIVDVVLSSTRKKGEADRPGPYKEGGASLSTAGRATVSAHDVLVSLRWPLLVVYQDTRHWHQTAIVRMALETIPDFFRDELYGHNWADED